MKFKITGVNLLGFGISLGMINACMFLGGGSVWAQTIIPTPPPIAMVAGVPWVQVSSTNQLAYLD